MNTIIKSNDAYKTIGEVTKELGLVNRKTGSLNTHTLRYWESKFKQIKPSIRAGKRRYYSPKDLEVIKLIKFLLKDKGLTINGAKKVLEKNRSSLDENESLRLYKPEIKNTKAIKEKLSKISKIIKDLKKFR